MSKKEFRPKNQSKVKLVYLSERRVRLVQECTKHPVLLDQLSQLAKVDGELDWADALAEIAAYCNVVMDGLYSEDDLEVLYPQLTKRMVDTRLGCSSGILLSSDTSNLLH